MQKNNSQPFHYYDDDEIDTIIEQKMTRPEIMQAKNDGKINSTEFLLLFSLDNRHFFRKILMGIAEYKLNYGSTVPKEKYFTNVPLLMNAFYSLYDKYPLYHFDQLFIYGLMRLCDFRFDLYEAIYLLHYHLTCEMEGKAAFIINAAPIVQKASEHLKNKQFFDILKKRKEYDASRYEDGLFGLWKDYDKVFVKAAGVSIFPD